MTAHQDESIEFPGPHWSLWPTEPIVRHEANRLGRDFVAGDIHGHFPTLELALEELAFDPNGDRLFSVGDLIDRGPRSADALEWIEQQRIASVRGNHEQMMVKALVFERGRMHLSGAGSLWRDNGGGWWWGWSGKYADKHGRPASPRRGPDHNDRLVRWLKALAKVPMLRTVETRGGSVGIVHTTDSYHRDWADICEGLRVGREHYSAMAPDSGLLWGRSDIESEDRNAHDLPENISNIDLIITGHTPGPRPRWTRRNVLCIDTGVHVEHEECGHLTLAEVQSGQPRLHRFPRRL